jgi:DNA-binding NarL/FixJ family response regulator
MTNSCEGLALIVDRMCLRRAQVVRFLDEWATANGLRIAESDVEEVTSLRQAGSFRIQILSLSNKELEDSQVKAACRVLASVNPDAPIVILGETADTDVISTALRIGASSYIPATLDAPLTLSALTFVLKGGTYFPIDALQALMDLDPAPAGPPSLEEAHAADPGDTALAEPPRPIEIAQVPAPVVGTPGVEGLTPRQCQVLQRLRLGQSNKQIARELEMSEATVKVHVRQVMKRLGVTNRTQAAVAAMKQRVTGISHPLH